VHTERKLQKNPDPSTPEKGRGIVSRGLGTHLHLGNHKGTLNNGMIDDGYGMIKIDTYNQNYYEN